MFEDHTKNEANDAVALVVVAALVLVHVEDNDDPTYLCIYLYIYMYVSYHIYGNIDRSGTAMRFPERPRRCMHSRVCPADTRCGDLDPSLVATTLLY